MNKQKFTVLITAVLTLIIFGLGAFYYQSKEQERLGFLAQENAELFVRPHSPTLGAEKPKVYLVEFLDPECESCRMFYPYVKRILADHSDQVTLVVRYAPFHHNSRFAVTMLEATRKQNKYWESLEVMFKTQPQWGSHHNPQPEKLWDVLRSVVGLDMRQLKQDINDPAIQKVIEQDIQDLKALDVRRTPSFFVNGQKLQTFGYEPLVELIQQELNK